MCVRLLRGIVASLGVAIALSLTACSGGGGGGGGEDAASLGNLGTLTLAVRDAPSSLLESVTITVTEAGIVYDDGTEQTFSFPAVPFKLEEFVVDAKLIAQLALNRGKDRIQSLRLVLGPVDVDLQIPTGIDGQTAKHTLHRDKVEVQVPLTCAEDGEPDCLALIDIPIESWLVKDDDGDEVPDRLEIDEALLKGIDWVGGVLPIKGLRGRIESIDPIAGVASILADLPGSDGETSRILVDCGLSNVIDVANGTIAPWWKSLKVGDRINMSGAFRASRASTQEAGASSGTDAGFGAGVLALGEGLLAKLPSEDDLTRTRVLTFCTLSEPGAEGWIVAKVIDTPLARGLGPFSEVGSFCMALDLSGLSDADPALAAQLEVVGAEFLAMLSSLPATTTLDCDGIPTTSHVQLVRQAASLETTLTGKVVSTGTKADGTLSFLEVRICQINDSVDICATLAAGLDLLPPGSTVSDGGASMLPTIGVDVGTAIFLDPDVKDGARVTVTGYSKGFPLDTRFRATKVKVVKVRP